MVKAWSDVATSPEFQSLNDNQQEQARQQYFSDVVAPKVPAEHIQVAKAQFDSDTGPANDATGKLKEFVHTGGKGLEAGINNIGDIESTLQAKATDALTGDSSATQAYQNSPARQETQDINTQQAIRTARTNKDVGSVNVPYVGNIGAGDVADFAGRGLASAPMAGAAGEALGAIGGGLAGAATGSTAATAATKALGNAYGAGAAATSSFPANAPTVDQSLDQRTSTANTSGWFSVGLSALGKLGGMAYNGAMNRTTAGAEQAVGAKLSSNPNTVQAVNDYTSTPKDQQPLNLPTSAVANNTDTLAMRKEVENSQFTNKGQKINAATELAKQTETAKTGISGELKNLNIPDTADVIPAAKVDVATTQSHIDRYGAPQEPAVSPEVILAKTTDEAQTDTGTKVRDLVTAKDKETGDMYKNIDPDASRNIDIRDVSVAASKLAESNPKAYADMQQTDFATKETRNILDKYSNGEGAGYAHDEDNFNSSDLGSKQMEIPIGESDTPKVSVKQMVQDYADLGAVANRARANMNNPLYADKGHAQTVINSANSAKAVIEKAISDSNLPSGTIKGNGETVPSTGEDVQYKTVGEAFNDAKQAHRDYHKSLLENPEFPGDNEPSEIGNYKDKGSPTLSVLGKKVIPIESPDKLGAALKTLQNVPNSKPIVTDNILANMKEKGIDEGFSPQVESILRNNGFDDVADHIKDIRDTVNSKNLDITQRNTYIDSVRQNMQDDLEKSFANKIVKNEDVSKLLTDKGMQQQALDLAAKQSDGGATTRGLGKVVLDRIRGDNIIDYHGLSAKTESEITTKFTKDLNANRDFLQKTIPDQLKDLDAIHDVAQKIRYSENTNALYNPPEGVNSVEKAGRGTAVTIGGQVGVPTSGSNALISSFTNLGKNSYKKVLFQAETDPYYAKTLMDASKKNPDELAETIKGLAQHTKDVLPQTIIQHNSNKQTPIDKEVQDATKPRSDNSSFSLISDANAAEFGPGKIGGEVPITRPPVSKKNSEYQIADAANTTGVSPDYIKATEYAESHTKSNPDTASNDKSSALGRGQFIKSTWNELAQKHGLPQVTASNENTPNDPRSNSKYSRLATGYYGAQNAAQITPFIKDTLGREATLGDLYAAHVVGAGGFKKLMSADPDSSAAHLMPAAAKNNPSLFYDKNGNAVSIRKWYNNIEDRVLKGISAKPTKAASTTRSNPTYMEPDQ